ncbi:MAG: hypothetical protein HY713_08380 [candidate division NC10 bacterium]|nr:hypothetical protein [candidate division NC10 bacterium]
MTTTASGLRGYALGRGAHSERRTRLRRLLCWGMTLAAAAVLPACDQSPPRRSDEPPATREEVARLREFVDLLHREIEQLQKDKMRLTEEVERLRLDNAALRAGKATPAPATREARTLPTPVNGRKSP